MMSETVAAISPSEAQQHLNVHLARFERDGRIAEPVIIHNGEGEPMGALIPVIEYDHLMGFYDDPEIGPILKERQALAIADIGGIPIELARIVVERAEAGEPLDFTEAQELVAQYGPPPLF